MWPRLCRQRPNSLFYFFLNKCNYLRKEDHPRTNTHRSDNHYLHFILEILLNLKQVILVSKETKTSFAHLKILGPRIITADCIDFPDGSHVLNPNLYRIISLSMYGSCSTYGSIMSRVLLDTAK